MTSGAVRAPTITPIRRSTSARRTVGAALAIIAIAVALVVGRADVSRAWSDAAGVARVPTTSVLMVCALLIAAHYVLLAAGLRVITPVPLPWHEALGVQMAAAVAGRFTPAGVGPAAVNVRYLTRSGLSTSVAIATIGTMNVVGALADGIAFVVLVVAGSAFGRSGIGIGVAGRLVGSPLVWLVVITVLVTGIAVMRARQPALARLADRARAVVRIALTDARQRPAALLRFEVASASTTVAFAAVFALLVADAAPGDQSIGALFVGYLVASAAANAIPIPGGIGSTDALLVAAAVAAGAPFGAAAGSIVVFRVLTFWAPVPIGIGAGVWLRRRGCL